MTLQREMIKDRENPLVTIVVPAKDDERFIRPCLRSIREQWFPSFECVIVDDGSSDKTREIAEEFAEKDERFRVVSHPTNRGPSAARNTGIENSSAPLVTFLDADDFLYKNSIRARVLAVIDAPSTHVAGSFCDWQPTPQNEGPKPPDREPTERDEVVGFVHGPECPFIVTSPMVRRSVLEQVGGFDESLLTAEDFDLWVRVLREGYTFTYVPMIGVAYRQKASGLVFSYSADHASAAVSVIEQQFDDLSADENPPLLSQPLSYYQLHCSQARRLLRTYSLAAASSAHEDAEQLSRMIPGDLDMLERSGLDVERELRAGVWRASRAIPELRDTDVRAQFVRELAEQLRSRPSASGADRS